MLRKAALVIIFAIVASGCVQDSEKTARLNEAESPFDSFLHIPGITGDEIAAIEKLKKERKYLTYGMIPSTEAFIIDAAGVNNEDSHIPDIHIGGYSVLFCEWLSGLFGIPFKLEVLPADELLGRLNKGEIDFSGNMMPAEENGKTYFMTDSIVERHFISIRLAESSSLEQIFSERPLRYAFHDASMEYAVSQVAESGAYEPVWADDFTQAYNLLKSGAADAYIATNIAEASFIGYDDLLVEVFFPLILGEASMTAADKELEPVISVVNKALRNGALPYLSRLYSRGYLDYRKHKLFARFSGEELAYINNARNSGMHIPVAAESSNYPLSFYNRRDMEWQGIFFDLLKEISLLTELSFMIAHDEQTSFTALQEKLRAGEAAFISELIRTREREKYFIWPNTLIMRDNYALISRLNYPNVAVNEIRHAKVGLARNTVYAMMFSQWFPNHTDSIEYDDLKDAFSALQRGEVDLVMSTPRRLMLMTHYQEYSDFKVNMIFNQSVETRMGFNRDEKILCSIIDKTLMMIDIEGITTQWTQRTYDYRAKMAEARTPWLLGAIALSILVFALILLIFYKNRNAAIRVGKLEHEVSRTARINSSILEFMPIGIVIFDDNMKIAGCNDELARMFNATKEQIVNRFFEDFSPKCLPDGQDTVIEARKITDRSKNGETVRVEWHHQTADGVPVPCDLTLARVRGEDEFIGIGFLYDLRSIKKLTQELHEQNELLKTAVEEANEANRRKNIAINSLESILNGIDALVYITVPETGELLFVNRHMKMVLGMDDEDLVGEYCYKIIRGFDRMCDFCPCFKLEENPDQIIMWDSYVSAMDSQVRHTDCFINWPNGDKVHLQHAVDITELINARRQAEQSSRSKSEFLSHMSHEIRTPMNAILGIAEIQLQNEKITPDIGEAFGKICESGDLLLNIINDILDLSKIESGRLEVLPVKYDIPSLINDTTQLNRMRYENKPILFTLDMDRNIPLELIGDELRIKQVLNNLLSNAFKYTEKGEVKFSVSAEPVQDDAETVIIVFSVRDTGQGMAEEQLKRIFEEYARFNLAANRTIVGTGLGLSITKRLVELMNGSIVVESKEGAGSVFTVRLPQKRTGLSVCGAELVKKLKNFNFKNSKIMKKAQLQREYMPYGSVLVVDDVESNIYVVKGMLAPYGLKIEAVSSGFDAIEKVKNGSVYDIIFMDHMMPEMDGMETTKKIRDMDYKHPIVALTANALVGQADIFLHNGFDAFVSKPIDTSELDAVLNTFIRDRKPAQVVEKARLEKTGSGGKSRQKEEDKTKGFELEKFALRDLENALAVLKTMNEKKYNLNSADLDVYILTAHTLKSIFANLGETEMSGAAFTLEKAGKEKNFVLISAATPGLINEVKSLIDKIRQKEKSGSELPDDAAVSEDDRAYLREKLLGIKTACAEFDINTAKTALDDLRQKTWPRNINAVLDDIAAHILHSDFSEAESAAASLVS